MDHVNGDDSVIAGDEALLPALLLNIEIERRGNVLGAVMLDPGGNAGAGVLIGIARLPLNTAQILGEVDGVLAGT